MRDWEPCRRPVNDWGDGDLPAPWAVGDRVLVAADAPMLLDVEGDGHPRSRRNIEPGEAWVCAAYSIDEGDAWYFRLTPEGHITRRGNFVDDGLYHHTDRLHVAFSERCEWGADTNWMEGVTLVETQDPNGLARREEMLAAGWSWSPPTVCPACNRRVP